MRTDGAKRSKVIEISDRLKKGWQGIEEANENRAVARREADAARKYATGDYLAGDEGQNLAKLHYQTLVDHVALRLKPEREPTGNGPTPISSRSKPRPKPDGG